MLGPTLLQAMSVDHLIAVYLGAGLLIMGWVVGEVGVYLWRQHRMARCRRECNRIHEEMRRAAARRVIS